MGENKNFGKMMLQRLRRLLNVIKQRVYPTVNLLKKDMPYLNIPIPDEKADGIGMDVYVDYLESAIEKRASMIAVVSRFGTGKSSLLEMLKRKYYGWEKGRRKRVYCQINLWSQLAGDTLELHRNFLYQLVATIEPKKSSYFSRRTGRNFGMFRISTESPAWNIIVNVIAVIAVLATFAQNFTEDIAIWLNLEESFVKYMIVFTYVVCAGAAVMLILKTEIIFSSKNSEGNRKIEENELIDLYRDHVLRKKTWWRKIWTSVFGTKHLVVIIEDLDRSEDGESIYHFLKELRKYYVPDEQLESAFLNKVTFVVNIMPENMLYDLCGEEKKKRAAEQREYVYDKLFDYELHLNRINIDNFDAVLESLIQEKKKALEELYISVQASDNTHSIPGMQWIIYGKKLSLRQIKERLNDAILLYESLLKKFDVDHAEFEMCAVVAYLRSAYPEEFYKLPDRELAEMIEWYAIGSKTAGSERSVEKFIERFQTEEIKWSEAFLSDIYRAIVGHKIDGNFRTYFFNYPKNSHLYTIREMNVRNLVIYDEELTMELVSQIKEVWEERPEVILNAMETVIELMGVLPLCVIYSEELWNAANIDYFVELLELVTAYLSDRGEWDRESYNMIDSVMKFTRGPEVLRDTLINNSNESVMIVRRYILQKHVDKLEYFTNLFQIDGCSLEEEELEKMEQAPLDVVLKIVTPIVEEVSWDVAKVVCKRVLTSKDRSEQETAETFFCGLAEVYRGAEIADYLISYMFLRQRLLERLEVAIYEDVKDGELESESYYRLLNEMPLEEIGIPQLKRIKDLEEVGKISKEICSKLKDYNMNTVYLVNMIVLDKDRITLKKREVLEVLEADGVEIWGKHPTVFKRIRLWLCEKYKNNVVEYDAFFSKPYPLITNAETRHITELDVALFLYDTNRTDEDTDEVFVSFCNRQFRTSTDTLKIFEYIATMEESVIPKVFYSLNMKKVKFAGMAKDRKARVVQLLRMPLKLTNIEEIIRFLEFTGSLVEELERDITDDLKNASDELCKKYIDTVEAYGKVTSETVKNVVAMPYIYQYGDVLNEALYKRRYYTYYVASNIKRKKEFVIENDKLDVLWPIYMKMLKSVDGFTYSRPFMYANKAFLEMVQARKEYSGLPEKSRMAMAQIRQDEGCLEEVLLNYSEDFIIKYYCSITGFVSKNAAEKFVSIMKDNQKYAQNREIYEHVHELLENPNLKRQYTYLFNKANE